MSNTFNEDNYSSKMNKSIQSFKRYFNFTHRKSKYKYLDTIKVDIYGQLMPINQLATVSVPEARLISIQVWDKKLRLN